MTNLKLSRNDLSLLLSALETELDTNADYLKKYPDRLHITRPYFQVRGDELRNLADRVKDAYNHN